MDYEKAYKEALKKIREGLQPLSDGAKISGVTRAFLEEVFPELKESEDEKIRKALIKYCKLQQKANNIGFCGISLIDAIAWLEKQAPVEHFELKKGHWYMCHRAYCCRADHLTVKEGERFQCEKDGIVKGFAIKDPEKYFIEVSAPAPMEDDQNDEVRRRSTIQVLEYAKSLDAYNQYGKEDIDKDIAWLEKQGESYTKKDIDDAYLKGISDAKDELEKQGEQKPKINIAYMVSEYASTPEQGNEGFGKPMNCMVRAYRQGILDTLKKIKQNNVVEEQQNITECESKKIGSEGKDLPDKHQWEDGDIIRLKKDDGVRWQIFKSSESEMFEGWFMSQIMENGIAGGYVNSFILDAKYEFLHNPCKEFLKKC